MTPQELELAGTWKPIARIDGRHTAGEYRHVSGERYLAVVDHVTDAYAYCSHIPMGMDEAVPADCSDWGLWDNGAIDA